MLAKDRETHGKHAGDLNGSWAYAGSAYIIVVNAGSSGPLNPKP